MEPVAPVAPERPGGATTEPPSTEPRPTTAPTGPARRLPGLDGLRALAVVAVVAFHLDPRWLPGGFLGVDVFFVVSGFLITTLLLRERASTGSVDLRAFWTRRARRLLPALLLVVPSAVLLARVAEGDLLVGAGRQVLGALTFTSNWLEIGAGSDYFAATAPTLLANLWSLAVEEQFYLLWPLALLVLLRVVRRPDARAGVALGLALASSLLMALRLDPDHPTRVYYGTDTHATGLMVGAALALSLTATHRAGTRTAVWDRHRRTVGVVALLVLGTLVVRADEQAALTFRGGILLASLATAAVVLVVVERPGRLRALLELPALRWVGARSYGIYLWHWPVVLVVGQDLPVTPGGVDYVLTRGWALIVTLAAADLSYRFVETPVRRLGFGGAIAALARWLRSAGTRRARVVVGVLTTAALATAVV
ncbi:MAG: acyltransferase, partial [Micrococcales bacterium]|nr:acyltransferase [Micrococcales bacterium]